MEREGREYGKRKKTGGTCPHPFRKFLDPPLTFVTRLDPPLTFVTRLDPPLTFVTRLGPAASSVNSRHSCSTEPAAVNCRAFLANHDLVYFIFPFFTPSSFRFYGFSF